MAYPSPKKVKASSVFTEFAQDARKTRALRLAKEAMLTGFENYHLRLLKINVTNAEANVSFTDATCRYAGVEREEGNLFSAAYVFNTGWNVLHQYLECSKLPKDKVHCKALRKLIEFWSNDSEPSALKKPVQGVQEDGCEWAWRLVEHFLSKLAAGDKFSIDPSIFHNKQMKEKYKNDFGDTSFGVPGYWHGRADILTDVPVKIVHDDDADEEHELLQECDQDADNEREERLQNSSEVNTATGFSDSDEDQMFAQAIVFSFLQKKHVTLDNYLTPCLGISKERFKVVFYDCVNDLLMDSKELPIFEENGEFNVASVVFIWFILNYRYFCSGLPDELKQYKSNFHDKMGDLVLSKYRDSVVQPCKSKEKNESRSRVPWECAWAVNVPAIDSISDSSDFEDINTVLSL